MCVCVCVLSIFSSWNQTQGNGSVSRFVFLSSSLAPLVETQRGASAAPPHAGSVGAAHQPWFRRCVQLLWVSHLYAYFKSNFRC